MAYHQDLPLQTAALRIAGGRAQLGIAVGRQYPQLQLAVANVAAIGLSDRAASLLGQGASSTYGEYQVGFDAIWEADFWQKYKKGVKADAANLYGSVADYDNALVSLTAEVARTYTVIRTYEVLIGQAQQNVALQEESLRIADARYRNGATSELDVDQAKTLLESTRATIPPLLASLQQAENALCTLLGQSPGSLDQMLAAPKGIPTAPSSVAVGVPAEMLRRRPDIRSAELTAVAQSDRVGIAAAEMYPQFSLGGTLGFNTFSGGPAGTGGPLFDAASFFYRFAAGLMYPLLNYGRIKNNVRVQDAVYEQSLIDYKQTVLKAAQEVDDGMAGFLRSQESVVSADSAVQSAQRSADLSMTQYREGAVDFQRVVDAQRSLLQDENTLTNTRSSVATNLIALYKAIGGGWQIRVGQPFLSDSTRTEMQQRTDWGDLLSKPLPKKPATVGTAVPR
jgi:NodT family efflux transporter outer membrane factor (OMF) lipoprotein